MARRRASDPMLGDLSIRGHEGQGMRVALGGKDAGALHITVTQTTGPVKRRGRYVQLYIRWEGRPEGGNVMHEDRGFLGADLEYVTHARLDTETGLIEPHYSSEPGDA